MSTSEAQTLDRDASPGSRIGGRLHSPAQSGGAISLGRHSKERAHGADLILILFHSPVEGAPVFGADQSLRRPHSFGDVRHVQTVPIDHVVKVLTAFFLYAKPMNPFEGIKRESLQFAAIRTGTGELDIQPPVSRRLGRKLAAL
jgi:hypothetical protein